MPHTIIIADESPTVQAFLAEIFTRSGYRTAAARNADEVAGICESGEGDLLLLDLALPGLDSFELLSHLKRQRPFLSIIALTEDSHFQTGIDAMRHGADDVLVQPATPSRLMAAVERGLEQTRQAKVIAESSRKIEALRALNQSIIEHSPMAIAVLDLNGTVGYINSKMVELLRAERGDFQWLGADLFEMLLNRVETSDDRFEQAFREAMELEEPRTVNAWHVRADGQDRYLDVNLTPLWAGTKDSSAGGMLASFNDITRWILSNQLLRSVLKDSSDAIVVTDTDLVIRTWSRGAELLFGYSAEEAIGHPLGILLPHGAGERATDVTDVIPGTAVRTKRRTKDGSLIDVRLSHSVLTDPQGRPLGVCEITRDISRDLQREREVSQIKDFYERIIDTISDCIRVIEVPSHRIVFVNKAHLARIGRTEEETLDHGCSEIAWGQPLTPKPREWMISSPAQRNRARPNGRRIRSSTATAATFGPTLRRSP